jgi:hypothetical protein
MRNNRLRDIIFTSITQKIHLSQFVFFVSYLFGIEELNLKLNLGKKAMK